MSDAPALNPKPLQVQSLMASKDSAGYEARLIEHIAVLEKCMLKLDQFVDIKCQSFPRLLLLDRPHLVRLLSCGLISGENVDLYQAAVRVCFPGVERLMVRMFALSLTHFVCCS